MAQEAVFKYLMHSSTNKKESPLQWSIRYVREAKEELKKVTWPSKEETTKYSIVTIVISLLIAGFFGGLDWVLTLGLEQLVNLTS